MSKIRLGTAEYRTAAVNCIGVFALLVAALMTTMPISEIAAPNTLLIVGVISLAAAIADLIIKYRRLQKGIRTEDLLRQVERDIASRQHFVTKPRFLWSMMAVGALAGGLGFLLRNFAG